LNRLYFIARAWFWHFWFKWFPEKEDIPYKKPEKIDLKKTSGFMPVSLLPGQTLAMACGAIGVFSQIAQQQARQQELLERQIWYDRQRLEQQLLFDEQSLGKTVANG
jgi:hypothetical protein